MFNFFEIKTSLTETLFSLIYFNSTAVKPICISNKSFSKNTSSLSFFYQLLSKLEIFKLACLSKVRDKLVFAIGVRRIKKPKNDFFSFTSEKGF